MSIPIQNIYYLLSYAWHLFEEHEEVLVAGQVGESEFSLLAYLLQRYTHLLLKKGLTQTYISQTETIPGIKGKLNITATLQKNLLRQGKANCSYTQLSPDCLPNQLIKSTIEQVLNTPELPDWFHRPLQFILSRFNGVQTVGASPEDFRKANTQYYFNPYYYPVLSICELLDQQLLPAPEGEGYYFRSFLEDEKLMAKLFEVFVRNFYLREQTNFQVKSEKIAWQLENEVNAQLQYLPIMVTDISLTSANRQLIIDTKFYKSALQAHYNKQKLISGHLYQLFAYLKNQPAQQQVSPVEGILLYPVVQQELDLVYQLHGNRVSIKTINLNQPWLAIKTDLLQLIA
jgi:5-methylcytosine-specific restriction enzyme subunit McrC